METEISTHALTEGDRKDMFCSSVCMNFNSRPHGGRPVAHEVIAGQWGFQLTPSRRATRLLATIPTPGTFQLTPSRRATSREKQYMDSILFQLTPSRRATSARNSRRRVSHSFQLTPSRRATIISRCLTTVRCISTHALTEGDVIRSHVEVVFLISTHALTGGDKLYSW